MQQSIFEIPKMDCPSEEHLIRMKLEGFPGVEGLEFDIENRKLVVYHQGPHQPIEASIRDLNLGGRHISTAPAGATRAGEESQQRRLLWAVLIINFSFFLIELVTGWVSRSMGLVADSLDMLADSLVYGMSLLAVGGTLNKKKQIAKIAGVFQMALAIMGFAEVLRRFLSQEALPNFSTMMGVSALALIANAICLYLLQKSRGREEAHMKASMIFTSNDVIINLGVILAGFLVHVLQSNKPDLIIGTIVFVLVVQGAMRILKLSK
ncbi:cation transporter [Robiginitalea sediminis]|uniref:cation transporter n=1 Tax=Robiginitalea sediminis TaxID=1982593 RepID=UPI000B4B0B72|nr:cation transporter [Robiginitalea sediminis]